jgi:hypothetical protein
MRNVSEKLVQLADRLFDLSDLALTFNDQILLEVDITLFRQSRLVEKLTLLLTLARRRLA